MKKLGLFLGAGLLTCQLHANSSTGSELSHVAGGAVMAGAITAIVDNYFPEYAEDRQLIGFGLSSILIIIEQGIEIAQDSSDAKGEMMDATAHIGGSIIGAWITDEYILSPIVKTSPEGDRTVGLQVSHSF
ncbi:MAG TPA: hypothetical protein ENJ71_02250 [Epsilonproteobacteria bacterium]|nr:hypothetical protein [Campylobacterota bacterium]